MADIIVRQVTRNIQVKQVGRRGPEGADGATGPQGPAGAQGPQGNPGQDGLMTSVVAGDNITVDSTDPANPIVSADDAPVQSVNSQTGVVSLDTDDVPEGTNKYTTAADISKLSGIEAGAEVNNISDANATDLTDSGASTLHYHASDRDRANHTGTQAISTVSGLQTALDGKEPTQTKGSLIQGSNVTLSGTLTNRLVGAGDVTIAASGGGGGGGYVDSVNSQTGVVVLDADDISDSGTTNKYVTAAEKTKLSNTSGTNTGDQTLAGLGGVPTTRAVNTKALSSDITLNQDEVLDGTTYKQYSATEKTKLSGIATGATANSSDATLLARANHTGTQTASTISDFSTAADARITAATGVSVQGYNANTTTLGNTTTGTGSIVRATSPALTTPTGIVKGDVGLGNVDNTSNATERAATATLTNKRVTPRVSSTASSATPIINTDNVDEFDITALAADITSMTTNLTGTPTNGQKLLIRIKGDATPRTISWGASFISSGTATLLATTVANKTHYVGFIYDSTVGIQKWVCVAVDATGY